MSRSCRVIQQSLTILSGIVLAASAFAQQSAGLPLAIQQEGNQGTLQPLIPSSPEPTEHLLPAYEAPAASGSSRPVVSGLSELGLASVPEDFGFPVLPAEAQSRLTEPWWHQSLKSSASPEQQVELEDLIWVAIAHSPHIQSVLLEPQIMDTRASSKLGAFDPNRFVDSIFKDTSDPVGNSLITGGPPRLNDNLWENRAGVRAKNQYGGQTELFQEMLFKGSNSRFFTPSNQSDSRMVLQYTQPLKRGRGSAYNRSSFVIASFAANQSRYQAASEVQEHVYRITEAYWGLFASRVGENQIQRGISNLEQLELRLKGRSEIDSLRSQVLRAEAAIAKQNAAAANYRAQVRSSEANLRALIASPELRNSAAQIVPISAVIATPPSLDSGVERVAALENQPQVLEIQEEIKAARTKLQVAQNELQPTLNLVLQGYLRGLSGDYDLGESLQDQFTSTPSYHAGIAYQRPKGNLAAQAIARESRMELRRALLKLDETLLSVSANVETALAGVEAAFQQLDSAVRSTLATQEEIRFLESQWNDAFMSDTSRSSLQIDQLLNAHIQLIASENNWVAAERDYMLSLARLDLATGTLLQAHNCPIERAFSASAE